MPTSMYQIEDDDDFYDNSINKFLDRTKDITLKDLELGHNKDYLLRNTIEEIGEYAAAVTIESGIKQKELKESSKQEAIDVIICALSLFYASGGNIVSWG